MPSLQQQTLQQQIAILAKLVGGEHGYHQKNVGTHALAIIEEELQAYGPDVSTQLANVASSSKQVKEVRSYFHMPRSYYSSSNKPIRDRIRLLKRWLDHCKAVGADPLTATKQEVGGKMGGKATKASHGEQIANGPRAGGKATKASHGQQIANGPRAGGKAGKGKVRGKGSRGIKMAGKGTGAKTGQGKGISKTIATKADRQVMFTEFLADGGNEQLADRGLSGIWHYSQLKGTGVVFLKASGSREARICSS